MDELRQFQEWSSTADGPIIILFAAMWFIKNLGSAIGPWLRADPRQRQMDQTDAKLLALEVRLIQCDTRVNDVKALVEHIVVGLGLGEVVRLSKPDAANAPASDPVVHLEVTDPKQ